MHLSIRNRLQQGWLGIGINVALALLFAVGMVGLFALPYPFEAQIQLTAGEVAQQDVVAPRRITYESAVLTQQSRDRAAQNVPDYYDPPLSRLRRQQVQRASEILDFITTVRVDTLASRSARVDYLLAVGDLGLTRPQAEQILDLPPADWQTVQQEVPAILDVVMREDIKENALAAARRRIPVLISPELEDDVATVITVLVQALVRPNSFLNLERTEELRQQARESVSIQTNTLEKGEVILRAGDIVSEEDVEALEQMGLTQSRWSWWSLVEVTLVSVLLLAIVVGTIYRLRPDLLASRRQLGLLALLSGLGLVLARLMVIPHDWMPFLFPLAAFSMLLALLLDLRLAIIVVLCFALVIGYLSKGNVTLIYFSSVGALLGALVLGKAERLTAFLWAGLAVILANLLVTTTFWPTPLESTSTSELLRALSLALLNGSLATSIALIGYFVLGNLFSITTNLQLMELSRPTHPLLRQLLLKAPGTYHHTILVSNLAERAAEAIGADAFLTRVGAYYHDIGKTSRPYFFAENISDGDSSPHGGLDPQTSAQIIISHVKDGVDLARKYKLPPAIQDFIWQHHGAQLMAFFYRVAREEAEDPDAVEEADFRYPGPDPQTKEAAITMLADTCEAAVRAERPGTRDELEALVEKLITQRVLEGALDQCNLTFEELQTIRRIFVQVLQGVHHPRVKYPDSAEPREGKAVVPPDTATRQSSSERTQVPANGRNGGRPGTETELLSEDGPVAGEERSS